MGSRAARDGIEFGALHAHRVQTACAKSRSRTTSCDPFATGPPPLSFRAENLATWAQARCPIGLPPPPSALTRSMERAWDHDQRAERAKASAPRGTRHRRAPPNGHRKASKEGRHKPSANGRFGNPRLLLSRKLSNTESPCIDSSHGPLRPMRVPRRQGFTSGPRWPTPGNGARSREPVGRSFRALEPSPGSPRGLPRLDSPTAPSAQPATSSPLPYESRRTGRGQPPTTGSTPSLHGTAPRDRPPRFAPRGSWFCRRRWPGGSAGGSDSPKAA